MPALAPPETLAALGGGLLPRCDSRTLFKDRFADPQASDKSNPTRKDWFNSMLKRNAVAIPPQAWQPTSTVELYARLSSRLLVDLAGGVMENANVSLDRFGLPIIAGSAVKGCARRMALQALHDWIEAGNDRPTVDDACAPCCDGFKTPAEMLAAVARIFGWSLEDWKSDKKDGYFKSDFAWACGGQARILEEARRANPPHDTFTGTIAFLAASPNRDPGIELDVVTPHHTKYYQGERGYETAPDTEDPVPVFFPAVRAQGKEGYFTFPIIPLRLATKGDQTNAKRWLANGLELLGVGAKTNAGYGWFDTSEALQESVRQQKATAEKAEKERKEREAENNRRRVAEEAARKRKEQEAAATADMTPEQKADWKLAQLTAAQLAAKLNAFHKEPKKGGPAEEERAAIIRALRGLHAPTWAEFKAKATKGDLATAANAIRALNKELFGDKMP